MKVNNFHTIVWKENDLYVARCVEVNVTSQGTNHQEALANLKEALELYLEDSEEIFPQVKEVEVQEVTI